MEFASVLLKWFRENGRDLPWRQTRDPYAIWLSEIILQQTQVKQGWDYWERFMHRWPTVEALAAATEDEVLREWQGLGYYSRARNLHYAAKQIVALGHFPDTLDEIRKLKGVGDYTAAAIGSIAFGLPAAVVDGNVYRVLARHFGIDTPINTTEGKKTFTALAQSLLPSDNSQFSIFNYQLPPVAAYNQAIMDFGAIQCTPSSPRCLCSREFAIPEHGVGGFAIPPCPLMETCVAFRSGRVSDLPVKLKTLKVRERRLTYYYIRCHGKVALHRRGTGDIWQGLWEPYVLEGEHSQEFEGRLTILKRGVRHVLTHRVLLADFLLLETEEQPQLPDDYLWIPEAELDRYAVPRLVERLYETVNGCSYE